MEYTISGQELERLRKTCKLRLTISVILAVAVYLPFWASRFGSSSWETRKWGRGLTPLCRKNS